MDGIFACLTYFSASFLIIPSKHRLREKSTSALRRGEEDKIFNYFSPPPPHTPEFMLISELHLVVDQLNLTLNSGSVMFFFVLPRSFYKPEVHHYPPAKRVLKCVSS